MKNMMSSLLAGSLIMAGTAGAAHAALTPDGTHVFTGNLILEKNLPVPSSCSVPLTLTVVGGVATAAPPPPPLTGSGIGCPFISFGAGPYNVTQGPASGGVAQLTVEDLDVYIDEIPGYTGEDACSGSLTGTLVITGSGNYLTFSTPTSSIDDALPDGNYNTSTLKKCLIDGVLTNSTLTGVS